MFTKVYALPNFEVTKQSWDKFLISLDQLEEAHSTGKTIAVQLPETNYGVLDFDAHNGTSGIETYNSLYSQFPDFFERTYTELTGNGGYHVWFNKAGKLNQNALKHLGEVDVFDGYGGRWMVLGVSRHKAGVPAEYKVLNRGPVLDLPEALHEALKKTTSRITGSTSLTMPEILKPLTAEQKSGIYNDTFDDWGSSGNDRDSKLFALVSKAFRKGNGTPQQRMGKALWLAEQVFEKATLPIRNAWTVDDFWDANKNLSAMMDSDISKSVSEKKSKPVTKSPLQFISLADTNVERLEYLWDSRLVNGVAALMPAKQGMGKSTVSIDLASSLSRGKLPGKYFGTPRSTFVLAAEDDEARVMRPRALVNGFDFNAADITLVNYAQAEDGSLSLPNLKEVLDGLQLHPSFDDHALVVVDTPVRFIAAEGDAATNSYGNVMMLMLTLNRWAQTHDKTVLLLWHLNKDGETMGSAGWEAGVRNVIKLEEDPDSSDENMTGLLYVSKMNGAPTSAPPLRYTFSNTPGEDNGVGYSAAKVSWEEAFENKREMMSELQERKNGKSSIDIDLINFLQENAPVEGKELVKALDHSESTVRRALSRLVNKEKIFKSKKQFQGGVQYALTPFEDPKVDEEWLVEN